MKRPSNHRTSHTLRYSREIVVSTSRHITPLDEQDSMLSRLRLQNYHRQPSVIRKSEGNYETNTESPVVLSSQRRIQ